MAKQEDTEHTMCTQVRQLEAERRKQEQAVIRLKEELITTQKLNKIMLKVSVAPLVLEGDMNRPFYR